MLQEEELLEREDAENRLTGTQATIESWKESAKEEVWLVVGQCPRAGVNFSLKQIAYTCALFKFKWRTRWWLWGGLEATEVPEHTPHRALKVARTQKL